MTQLDGEPSSKMEMMLQKLLEDMRDMKGKLEDVDRRGSSKTPLDATPSHLIVQDTLSPNVTLPTKAHNEVTLPKGGWGSTSKSSTTSN
ncbi:hypothetical protein KY289_023895 [Solanum tuberosum]|nr:hypothetical protein KY289_023895 [Solanum tuberosum]